MTAKEYFETVEKVGRELKLLLARREYYYDMGLRTTSHISPVNVRSSGAYSKVEEAVIGADEMLERVNRKIELYKPRVEEAERIIDQIEQDRFREYLTYRFLCGMKDREVAAKMGYKNPESIYKVRGWALRTAQPLIDALRG